MWNRRNGWSLRRAPVSNKRATPMPIPTLALAALALLTAGCAMELPTASAPPQGPPPLTEEDQAVVAALAQQALIPRHDAASGDAPPLALISDITLRGCEPEERNLSGVECLYLPQVARYLTRHPEWGTNLVALFSTQNARPRRITLSPRGRMRVVSVRDDIRFVPSRPFSRVELLWLNPRGSQFYVVSAPAYQSEREALIWFRAPDSGGGVAYFVQEGERWVMRGLDGWVE